MILWCGVTAQKTDTLPKTSSYLSIGIGAAVPVGAFAATSGTGLGAYANAGNSRYISGGLIVNKIRLGFVITEGAFSSFYKTNTYLGNLKAPDTVKNASFVKQGGGDMYTGGFGMLGIMTDLRAGKLTFDLKLMGGRFTVLFPELAYYESGTGTVNQNIYVQYDYVSTETYSLAFSLGLDARYSFSKHFAVVAEANYLYTQFFYSTIEGISNTLVGNEATVSIVNITAGVAYQF